jgi:radical SAM protein with 4Fe4S-binding SPASM domain
MKKYISSNPMSQFSLWPKLREKRTPVSFELEITARCNNDCRHCYINLPAADSEAQKRELSSTQIGDIAGQAVAMGGLWCLLTGGEPLLREDFFDIYLMLKKKGLLVSIFTNACLITPEHIALFKRTPPLDIEITVYGITPETYERVTRCSGSYASFRRGLDMLLKSGMKVRLKAMALRSNVSELPAIAAFCRQYTMDYFRFDPLLHLRYDGKSARNMEIKAERLTKEEIVEIEQADPERSTALKKNCDHFIFPERDHQDCGHLFQCGAGKSGFTVSPEGYFRLCASLWHPECVADLKATPLASAWNDLVPRVRGMTSSNLHFLINCRSCKIVNLCLWCPAHAHLETGKLDGWSEFFCQAAQARAEALQHAIQKKSE